MRVLRLIALFFSGLAAIGFVASLVEHVAALMGHEGPLGSTAMWLHAGVFVVCVPAVFASIFLVSGVQRRDRWSATFRGCPRWMKYLVYFFFAYAFVNFAFVIPNLPTGRGSLSAAGVFSVGWMAFYSAAAAILYSAAHNRDERFDE